MLRLIDFLPRCNFGIIIAIQPLQSPAQKFRQYGVFLNLDFEVDYTFDRFVTTPYNELAFEAAQAIVREPGIKYNPFFFHGGLGSGKTHLLHAVGNVMREERPSEKIQYVNGDRFAADIAAAVVVKNKKFAEEKKLALFYRTYKEYDFLMIDGIDALADKDIEQNAMIRLFDVLWKQKKQVIITSRLPSHRFPVIEAYFRASYDTGLIADILAPEELVANRALLWD